MAENRGKNDVAWEYLFNEHHILDEIEKKGEFVITADQIKEKREPRLMTKFDHEKNLPSIFHDNGLSILPLTRGTYVISDFDTYHRFEDFNEKPKKIEIPSYLETLQPRFITSEAIALNCANVSGIFKDFFGDDEMVETISGRMTSGTFDFDIGTPNGTKTIKVINSQIEIDGAYEGHKNFALFEAKSDLSDDFLIRQLYYPIRRWSNDIKKKCIPVFLIYTNGTFYLYQYEFTDLNRYDSIKLVKQARYELSSGLTVHKMIRLINSIHVIEEPEISFPQADKMERVVNLVEILKNNPLTKQEITDTYDFDERQADYYANAGRYLGLIERSKDEHNETIYLLSKEGEKVINLPYKQRNEEIVKLILQHEVFRKTLKLQLFQDVIPNKNKIVEIMKESNLYKVESDVTYGRRASTVSGWCNWIINLLEN